MLIGLGARATMVACLLQRQASCGRACYQRAQLAWHQTSTCILLVSFRLSHPVRSETDPSHESIIYESTGRGPGSPWPEGAGPIQQEPDWD